MKKNENAENGSCFRSNLFYSLCIVFVLIELVVAGFGRISTDGPTVILLGIGCGLMGVIVSLTVLGALAERMEKYVFTEVAEGGATVLQQFTCRWSKSSTSSFLVEYRAPAGQGTFWAIVHAFKFECILPGDRLEPYRFVTGHPKRGMYCNPHNAVVRRAILRTAMLVGFLHSVATALMYGFGQTDDAWWVVGVTCSAVVVGLAMIVFCGLLLFRRKLSDYPEIAVASPATTVVVPSSPASNSHTTEHERTQDWQHL